MVAALIKGKRIEIHNLGELLKVVQTSIEDNDSLVMIGDHEERIEVSPTPQISEAELHQKRRDAFEAAFGSWRGLVDTEQLKRDIYENRGQRPRNWTIAETDPDE